MTTRRSAFIAIAMAVCGCPPSPTPSDAGVADATTEAEVEASAPFVMAAHVAALLVPQNSDGGGDVLTNANLVIVTYATYPFADDVEAMIDWVPTSTWLAAVGSEYGVGIPSTLAKVRLSSSPPAFTTTTDFTSYVESQVGSTVPAPPNMSTLYAFVLPAGAVFTDPSIGSICNSFTGYHDAAPGYAFAVIGTCPGHVPILTDAQQVERVLSHEVIEALTDPFGGGYASRDPNDPWSYIGGGEVADICNGYTLEQSFLAVRSWSNAAALANEDPCQPVDVLTPYFNVSPVSADVQHVSAGGMLTIALTGWSTALMSDWIVDPEISGASSFVPTIQLVPGTSNNGGLSQLVVGVPASAVTGEAGIVLVHSFHSGDAVYSLEPIVVVAD